MERFDLRAMIFLGTMSADFLGAASDPWWRGWLQIDGIDFQAH